MDYYLKRADYSLKIAGLSVPIKLAFSKLPYINLILSFGILFAVEMQDISYYTDANMRMKVTNVFITIFILFLTLLCFIKGQTASPSNWMYPEGNLSATKHNPIRSRPQIVDSMKIKWFTTNIRGDIQPLIGNIVQNSPIIENSEEFNYAPNEIVAVVGDTFVIMDGAGKTLTHFPLKSAPDSGNAILGVSALLDTAASLSTPTSSARTLIVGFETLEAERKDSLAVAYLGGWLNKDNRFGFIERLALNLKYNSNEGKDYIPNYSAAIKPVYARKEYSGNNNYVLLATINMSHPHIDDTKERPFFRGMTTFGINSTNADYPKQDVADYWEYRMHLGPQVSFAQPSITGFRGDSTNRVLLPCLPSSLYENNVVYNTNAMGYTETTPNNPYLFNFSLGKEGIIKDDYSAYFNYGGAVDLASEIGGNARIRSYFLDLYNPLLGYEETLVLMTTEYDGSDTMTGRSGLYLYDFNSFPLTSIHYTPERYPVWGNMNHHWSVAIGNVDGNDNEWLPCYPNNRGNEIIVTQTSRDFDYAGSKIMLLRYNPDFNNLTPKLSPPDEFLHYFDTICTFQIQGWVAAVNNIDGVDSKDEILLVSGSRIMLLRMKDYKTLDFRTGKYFDTLFVKNFDGQTIFAAAIADVDGDGRNDIVITTNQGMYVLGTPLERTIDVISLEKNDSTEICFGDTFAIKWRNIIQVSNFVNVIFEDLTSKDTIIIDTIVANYANNSDTATFNLLIDKNFAGKKGRFIIQDINNPVKNVDTTGIITFNLPAIITDIGNIDTLYVGAELTISGNVSCTQDVRLYYSLDSVNWVFVARANIDTINNTFNITTTIPCIADIFNCDAATTDTNIYGRIIYTNQDLADTTATFSMVLRPTNITIDITPCESACASRTIKWTLPEDYTDTNAMFAVYISKDTGKTFNYINNVPVSARFYLWNVPVNIETPIILRLCSSELCWQIDTIILNYKPQYIQTVAPNPIKIPQIAEVVYKVDKDVEASLYIIDQANRYVVTLEENVSLNGGFSYCARWDGRLKDRTPAANGMYYILLKLSNGVQEVYPIYVRN